jgi:hypothetical protein
MKRRLTKHFAAYTTIGIVLLQLLSAPLYADEAEEASLADLRSVLDQKMNKGWIDALDDQVIIIDDVSYPITRELKIYDFNGSPKGLPSLVTGQFVAFKAGEQLKMIYILPGKGNRPEVLEPSTVSNDEKSKGKALHYENGVWKN